MLIMDSNLSLQHGRYTNPDKVGNVCYGDEFTCRENGDHRPDYRYEDDNNNTKRYYIISKSKLNG